MEELKELKEKQREALKFGDFKTLNEINKQIFALREKARQEKSKARQQEQDNQTAKIIEEIIANN